MKDVMVDLETMGCGYRAAIVSIGAVRFDPIKNKLGSERFYQCVSLEDAQRSGSIIDASTVVWWLQQEAAARHEITSGLPLVTTLFEFAEFLGNGSRVWGNGSNFDNRILRDAYDMTGQPCPWHYRDDRDMRTICALAKTLGVVAAVEFEGTPHNALDDAIHQAKVVCAIQRRIKKR